MVIYEFENLEEALNIHLGASFHWFSAYSLVMAVHTHNLGMFAYDHCIHKNRTLVENVTSLDSAS